jgi:threonine/homoserine/homoserine lactone efflux protein
VALSLVWALLLIGATRPLGRWLRREKVVSWMDRSTGLIFVLFAARLALSGAEAWRRFGLGYSVPMQRANRR